MTDIVKEDRPPSRANAVANQIADLLKGTVELVTEYRCKHHPDRRATSVCEICKADICSDCSHIRRHTLICSKCMGGLDKAFGGTGVASPLARLLTHPFVIALVIAGLLGIVLFRLGSSHRMGLLGRRPENIVAAEKQFQLRLLLFARKAKRIETHGDSLHKMAQYEEASEEFHRSKAVYESMIDETSGRSEQALLMLARARLLKKLGHETYAEGLYENVATMPDPEKTHSVIALFHLGKLQEKDNPEKALESYKKALSRIKLIPANIRAAINLTVGAEQPYNYETRMHQFTGNDLNFNDIEAEANLRMGLVLVSLGRRDAAKHRFSWASAADNPDLRKWASAELRKLIALEGESARADAPPVVEEEEAEKVVITHF